jgi:rare lipoprotein A
VLGLSALTFSAAALPAAAETGIASIYSSLGVTASGRSYSTSDSVAAHKTLPLGSIVRIENLRNGRTATVTIVDRGPYISGRIIDVTPSIADSLGFRAQGLTPTRIEVVGRGASTGPYDRRGSGKAEAVAKAEPSSSKPVRTASSTPKASAPQRSARSVIWQEGS